MANLASILGALMSHDKYHDYLRSVPLFADLDKRELDEIGSAVTDLDLPAGRVIMTQGETAHEMVIVTSGTLEVSRDGEHIATIEAGGFAGELALLAHVRRNSTVVAKTDVSLLHIDGRQFKVLLEDVPELAVKMLPIVAKRAIDSQGGD
jgi:CRP-like cAMP-binding protein